MNHRNEQDWQGSVSIPSTAYWGIATQRRHQEPTAQQLYCRYTQCWAMLKAMAFQAPHIQEALRPEHSTAIQLATQRYATHTSWFEHIVLLNNPTPTAQDIAINLEDVLANMTLELLAHPKGAYHVFHPSMFQMDGVAPEYYSSIAWQWALREWVHQQEDIPVFWKLELGHLEFNPYEHVFEFSKHLSNQTQWWWQMDLQPSMFTWLERWYQFMRWYQKDVRNAEPNVVLNEVSQTLYRLKNLSHVEQHRLMSCIVAWCNS
jgi:hypothetical protein